MRVSTSAFREVESFPGCRLCSVCSGSPLSDAVEPEEEEDTLVDGDAVEVVAVGAGIFTFELAPECPLGCSTPASETCLPFGLLVVPD